MCAPVGPSDGVDVLNLGGLHRKFIALPHSFPEGASAIPPLASWNLYRLPRQGL
jgi:hypothetical protein